MKRLPLVLLMPLIILSGCSKPLNYEPQLFSSNTTLYIPHPAANNISGIVFENIHLQYTNNDKTYKLYGDNLTIVYYGDNVTFKKSEK